MRCELVVIGCSWGGLHALARLLEALPDGLRVPVAIAQHRASRGREDLLPALLQRHTSAVVTEAQDKDSIEPRRVYVAPMDYHMLVEPGSFALSVDERVQQARPSVDVLFESAADAYGGRTCGVVLTGANSDGAAGLARIKARGGRALVQDPDTAERREMPEAALRACRPDGVGSIEDLAAALGRLGAEVAA